MPHIQTLFEIHSSDLSLRHVLFHCAEPRRYTAPPEGRPVMGYSYCLRGDMLCSAPAAGFANQVRGGQGGLWKRPGTPLTVALSPGLHEWIEVEMRTDFVERVLEENDTRISLRLKSALRSGDAPFACNSGVDQKTRGILAEIFDCPFDGILRERRLVGKAMELVLEEFGRHGARRAASGSPHSHARQVREAAALLSANLETPLAIPELAARVGLGESTLARAFKKTYGLSLFSFFQAARMEHARRLLEKRELNITETAFSVGYSDPAHFTRAFRRHFGVPPKRLR